VYTTSFPSLPYLGHMYIYIRLCTCNTHDLDSKMVTPLADYYDNVFTNSQMEFIPTSQTAYCVSIINTSHLILYRVNPLNPELNPICYLLALLGAHHFLHVSRIRVKILTFGRLMSYIYGASILDVSRSHKTTQHSR